MPLERRIRDELRSTGDAIEPNVERSLGAVEARARRGNGFSPSLLLVAAVVVVVVVTLRLNSGLGPNPGPGASAVPGPTASASAPTPVPTPSPTAASYPEIAGTYVATLDAANAAVARDGVGGQWTLRLQPDGVALLSAPDTFQPGVGGLTGITFALTGDRLRTDLFYNDFCNSIGTYTWALAGGRLTLTPVEETCSVRRSLLSTSAWAAAP